ncbi:hypothetical protein ZIOFF_059649 [Zingiber officinale]|uniref:Uncharacterized protein n=1 Tax=Zingiber officinale TaxID=94328 RepID=A0A8J5FL38_ZINOF|nr:hypothetical protein ZIOFF_059649 [Zingiber officinale]
MARIGLRRGCGRGEGNMVVVVVVGLMRVVIGIHQVVRRRRVRIVPGSGDEARGIQRIHRRCWIEGLRGKKRRKRSWRGEELVKAIDDSMTITRARGIDQDMGKATEDDNGRNPPISFFTNLERKTTTAMKRTKRWKKMKPSIACAPILNAILPLLLPLLLVHNEEPERTPRDGEARCLGEASAVGTGSLAATKKVLLSTCGGREGSDSGGSEDEYRAHLR